MNTFDRLLSACVLALFVLAGCGGGGSGSVVTPSGGTTTPAVTSFAPATGPVGTTVTISGTNLGNFTPAPEVKFGTTVATVSSASATSIVVTVPNGLAAGNSAITLSNFDGTGVVTVGTFNVTAGGGAPAALAWTSHSASGITLAGGSLSDVAWSGSQFLSVGYANTVATSADGATWGSSAATFPGATPASAALVFNKVAYGNGVFVAIDYYGGAYSSPDGALWTQRLAVGNFQNKNGVDFANGKFFLTDGSGGIITSADGITWSARIIPVAASLNKVIWSGTQYVAVGSHILTSPDAVAWTDRGQITVPGYPVQPQYAVNFSSVVFANNLYVAVTKFSSGVAAEYTSTDGITWTKATTPSMPALWDITYGNGRFVAAGTGVWTSTDGQTWTQDTSADFSGFAATSVKFLNNKFLVVGGVQIITAP